jgi:hypothetical protein
MSFFLIEGVNHLFCILLIFYESQIFSDIQQILSLFTHFLTVLYNDILLSIDRAKTLLQSAYPDIALHISNYYIHIVWCYFDFSSFLWSQITVYMAINIEWKY